MNWYGYGHLLPLRILEEIRFWKEQEKEHTLVIRALVPDLEPPYVKLLEEWEATFANSERVANQLLKQLLPATHPPAPYIVRCIDQLMSAARQQSREFIKQLYVLLEQSAAVQAVPLAKVLILHFIRESEYFLGVLDTLGQPGILRETDSEPSLFLENALHTSGAESIHRQASEAPTSPDESVNAPASSAQIQSATVQAPSTGTTQATPGSTAPPVKEKPVPIGGHTLPPSPMRTMRWSHILMS